MPGRPTMKRKRNVSERDDKFSQVSSNGGTIQCQNCQQKGHNKKTCKNPHVEPDPKPNKKIGRPRLDPSLTQWTRRGRWGRRGNRGGGRVPRGGGGFHSWFERSETLNTVPSQKRVNEEYNSEEMVDVDVMSDADGLDMADMDYITQQIKELRKSGYTDVDIIRCLGITKAHLEDFGYVVRLPMLKVDWKEVDRVMKKKKDMDKEMKWKEVDMDKEMKKKKKDMGKEIKWKDVEMDKNEKEMEKEMKETEKKKMVEMDKKKMKEMEKGMKWKELKQKMFKDMMKVEKELKWKLKMFKEMKKVFQYNKGILGIICNKEQGDPQRGSFFRS
ncbi:unnamed protein product [Lactuca saligna]|uniref:Uncharacterized protein n=1 Tax=Lactuca saligna TaxID=75948 RepID=A0AA35VGG6_LACSI|nr:unnamed protein product [Lactuca saligna]